ncbi:MAG: M48 family metalloprotease [bacterium]
MPRIFKVLLFLMVAGMAAQVLPFVIYHVPDAVTVATTAVPTGYPPDYKASDMARANAFNQAILFGAIARIATWFLAMFALLASGIGSKFSGSTIDSKRAWLTRSLFLVALYFCFRLVELPFVVCRFHHFQAFGLTPLSFYDWTEIMLIGLPVPLALFFLKYLLVVCSFPLFKKLWWIAACLCIFILYDVLPEIVSRTYPLDPVETLSPLPQSPHADALKVVLEKAATRLPLMIVDQSNRAYSANVYIAGRYGRQYVVITDTFLKTFTPDDAALALAHEIGHLRNEITMRLAGKALTLLTLASGFFLAFLLTGRTALPISTALHTVMILMLCLTFASFLLQPLSNAFYRRQELNADMEAIRLIPQPQAYSQLLVKMAKQNLEPLDMPKWEEYLFSSYPSIMTRIAITTPGR